MGKVQYNTPVILTYSFLSFVALVLGITTNGVSTYLLFSVYKSSFADPFTYVRFLGHVLGHASFEHFFNNFLIILIVGPMLEEKHGAKNMLLMILFTAVFTGVFNMVTSDTVLLGASGIAFMLIVLSPFANVEKGKIPLTLILVVVLYIGGELISLRGQTGNVSHMTHIIGGTCGGIFGAILTKRNS